MGVMSFSKQNGGITPAALLSMNVSAGLAPLLAQHELVTRLRLFVSPVVLPKVHVGAAVVPLFRAIFRVRVAPALKLALVPLPLPKTLNSAKFQADAKPKTSAGPLVASANVPIDTSH
jgi:hypothetical protein